MAVRNNPASAREIFVQEFSSERLGSQIPTSLEWVTDMTVKVMLLLYQAGPSVPPHYLANTLFPVGPNLPALRISTFSAVVSLQMQVLSSIFFIPPLLAC